MDFRSKNVFDAINLFMEKTSDILGIEVNLGQRPTNLLTVLMLTNYGLNVNNDSLTMRKLDK